MSDSQQVIDSLNSSSLSELFARARVEQNAGRFAEARALYLKALAVRPEHADCHHQLGGLALQTGRLEEATDWLRKATALDSRVSVFHYNLATALSLQHKFEEAIPCYERAIALDDKFFEALSDLGDALTTQNRLADALAQYGRALALKPDSHQLMCKIGDAYQMQGAWDQAIGLYEKALTYYPDFAAALGNLGSALYGAGRFDDAAARFQQCVALSPGISDLHCNLGNALSAAGRPMEAIASFKETLKIDPASVKALVNLGDSLLAVGMLAEAEARYREALALQPEIPEALSNLGNALLGQGKATQAIGALERAISKRGDMPEAVCCLANAHLSLGHFTRALHYFDQALSIRSDYTEAICNKGTALLNQGRVLEGIACYKEALRGAPDFRIAHSNLLMALHYAGHPSGAEIRAVAVQGAPMFGHSNWNCRAPSLLSPSRRLRVGYVSADFESHPVGYFISRVIPQHDRSSIEVFCYSNNKSEDALTASLRSAAEHWRMIDRLSDAEATALIRQDAIDLLVDLSGHTLGNRLGVFALRAAPIQVTWLGYFGTTGIPCVDYVLADQYVVPGDAASDFTEIVWRLPNSYLCFAPPRVDVSVGQLPALNQAGLTFGCFSNLAKASRLSFELWAGVLWRLPSSRLLLKAKGLDDDHVRSRILGQFVDLGISTDRIVLEGPSPRLDYLGRYNSVDVMLDTSPFSGGTTTAEALWMGVPTVSLRGPTWAGRICESILTTVGLGRLVAATPAEYVDTVVGLASDLEALAALRQGLRHQLESSPLCDAMEFTADLEKAYKGMHTRAH